MNSFIQNITNYKSLIGSISNPYCVILGEQPSKGAKSPVLWNAVFEAVGSSTRMISMDVLPKDLKLVVDGLKHDTEFIGGAVTMPYKKDICVFLDELDEEAKMIGSVNCLYKKDGKLIGTNTDGAAALATFIGFVGNKEFLIDKTVLIFGFGGAGKAVAAFFAKSVGKNGTIIISDRNQNDALNFKQNNSNICSIEVVQFPACPSSISSADVIINCTSIGFSGERNDEKGKFYLESFTPLSNVSDEMRVSLSDGKHDFIRTYFEEIIQNYSKSIDVLLQAKKDVFVFDIIYQPKQTLFLRIAESLGFKILNGVSMNLEQAVIAFDKVANPHMKKLVSINHIREVMKKVW